MLELSQWNFKNLRNSLPEIDINKFDKSYWIGSVTTDSQDYNKFIAAISSGEIELANSFTEFGGDMIYAILGKLKDFDDSYELILVESPEEMTHDERLVFQKRVENLCIKEIESSNIDYEKFFGDTKITWWTLIKSMIWK